jgi:hypothetical protein
VFIDLFNISEVVCTYTTVAKAFVDSGFTKEVHEARMLKHIQAPPHMVSELGSRLMSRVLEVPNLKDQIESLLPGSKFRFRAEMLNEQKVTLTPNRCQGIKLKDASFGLLCVDRNATSANLLLIRR